MRPALCSCVFNSTNAELIRLESIPLSGVGVQSRIFNARLVVQHHIPKRRERKENRKDFRRTDKKVKDRERTGSARAPTNNSDQGTDTIRRTGIKTREAAEPQGDEAAQHAP